MFKLIRSTSFNLVKNYSIETLTTQTTTIPAILTTTKNSKLKLNKDFVTKIRQLPVKIKTNLLDLNTLSRLNLCSNDFLANLLQNLDKYGIHDKHLTNTLNMYDDWTLLSNEKLNQMFEMFRDLSFTQDVYLELFSRNPDLIKQDQRKIEVRLNEFKYFFTNKQLNKLLIKSPHLLTCNFDQFTYKFTYLFVLMGMSQDEQSRTNVFNHTIEHIRQRHLFLSRSGFFDKPNKKGLSKVVNPKLKDIMDTHVKEYLRLCTRNLFTLEDYDTFCAYLNEENFDDELLGQRIGSSLQKKIIYNIKQSKYEKYDNENK